MVKKSSDNTRLYIILGLLAFAIIVGTIVGSSYKELFTNPSKEIVYLYMETCGHCQSFTPVWDKIVKNNKDKFTFNKYDLNKDARGKELADTYNVTSAPTVMMLPISSNASETQMKKHFYEGDRTESAIMAWANSF